MTPTPRFDVPTAQEFARQGRLEDWIHAYLLDGPGANPGLSDGLKLQSRWWRGPLPLPLDRLVRACGPEAEMEYRVPLEGWRRRTRSLADSIFASGGTPLDIPPLIINYDQGAWSVRDGNHRHEAMRLLGWTEVWVIIWYNSLEEYQQDAGQFSE
jgi:hypothetical protein